MDGLGLSARPPLPGGGGESNHLQAASRFRRAAPLPGGRGADAAPARRVLANGQRGECRLRSALLAGIAADQPPGHPGQRSLLRQPHTNADQLRRCGLVRPDPGPGRRAGRAAERPGRLRDRLDGCEQGDHSAGDEDQAPAEIEVEPAAAQDADTDLLVNDHRDDPHHKQHRRDMERRRRDGLE